MFLPRSLDIQVWKESRIFGDIVQGSFLDSYRNLSYKVSRFGNNPNRIIRTYM
jgi:hypothetical protein